MNDGEWREVKLKDVLSFSYGKGLNKSDRLSSGGYPLIGSGGEMEERSPSFLVEENTIVIGRKGTIGSINLVQEKCWPIDTVFYTKGDGQEILNRYAYYLLLNLPLDQMNSDSSVPGLNRSQMESVKIKLPNIQTQKKIASILSALDDRIEHNNNLARLLEENAQALYHSWFVRFDPVRAKERGEVPRGINPDQPMEKELADLFPDKINSETGLPEGWEEKALSECASFLNGVAAQKYPPENNDFYPVLKIRELRAGGFNASDKASKDVPDKYIVKNGDIIFSWSASLLVDRWFGGKGVLNQHLFLVTPLGDLPEWFVYFTNKNYLEHFQNLAAAKGTTMGHIKRGDLDLAKVVVPSEDILRLAEITIGELYNLSGQLREESVRLIETRDLLLPRLVSGKIDLGAAKEEVEKA